MGHHTWIIGDCLHFVTTLYKCMPRLILHVRIRDFASIRAAVSMVILMHRCPYGLLCSSTALEIFDSLHLTQCVCGRDGVYSLLGCFAAASKWIAAD